MYDGNLSVELTDSCNIASCAYGTLNSHNVLERYVQWLKSNLGIIGLGTKGFFRDLCVTLFPRGRHSEPDIRRINHAYKYIVLKLIPSEQNGRLPQESESSGS